MIDFEALTGAEDFIGSELEIGGAVCRVGGGSVSYPVEIVGRVVAVEIDIVEGLDRRSRHPIFTPL